MFVHLRGFELHDLVWEGPRCSSFRATRNLDRRAVMVTVPRSALGGRASSETLQLESLLAAELDGVIPRPIELVHLSSGPVLVQELPAGVAVSQLIAAGMDLPHVLRVMIAVCRSLGALHMRRIIHNDLRPSSVFFDEETDRAILLDLSASYHPAWGTGVPLLSLAERDLLRVAPEQTGRTSHVVDHRADLYSLGVIFYEALNRELPFPSRDPAALVHAHLAAPPEPLRERLVGFPAPIVEIVLKLLAKSPSERYQGAFGVTNDLMICRRMLERSGTITSFTVARRDPSPRPRPPAGLVGREAALATLRGAAARVRGPNVGLVVVRGPSGVGKTAAVQAAFPPQPGYRLAAAQGDAVARDVPYRVIRLVCHALIRQLAAESGAQTTRWKAGLDREDGEAAAVLSELVPEIGFLLGPQRALPAGGPTEQQVRVERAFNAFFAATARPESPLLIFLDDIHSADQGTLSVLAWLLAHGRLRHTLFIVAAPPAEAGGAGTDRVNALLESARTAGVPVEEVKLDPLSLTDTTALLGAVLDPEAPGLASLGQLVREKTGGNPHFVLEFVRQLHANRLVTLDPETGYWHFDLLHIREAPAADNIRDLLMQRIRAIPVEARAILSSAACVSHEVGAGVLDALVENKTDVVQQLDYLVAEGFLIDLGDDGGERRFRFGHERVQEAALGLLDEQERARMHLAVGRILWRRSPGGLSDRDLYLTAGHLNLGLSAIADAGERADVGVLNLTAAERAFASAAFDDAFRYFSAAADLVPGYGETGYDRGIRRQVHIGLARSGYLCGRWEESERHFQAALECADSPLEMAAVHAARVPFYTQQGRSQRALGVCLEGLACLGLTLPAEPGMGRVLRRGLPILWRIWRMGPDELGQLPAMVDPERRARMRLLMNACLPATTLVRQSLVALLALEMMDTSLRDGISDESAFAFVITAMLAVQLGFTERAHALGRIAVEIASRSGDAAIQSWVLMLYAGFLGHLKNHLADSITMFERGYQLCQRTGEPLQGSMILSAMISLMPSTGHAIDAIHERALDGIAVGRRLRRGQALASSRAVLKWTSALSGLDAPAADPSDAEFESTQEDANWQQTLMGELINIQSAFLLGRHADAQASVHVTLRRPHVIRLSSCYREFFVFYRALVAAALADARRRKGAPRALTRAQRFFEGVAAHCPANGTHRHALLAAEAARLEGHADAAADFYRKAVAAAAANGFPHEAALAHELAGRFAMRAGQTDVGIRSLRAAQEGYRRWGAARKVALLDAEIGSGAGDAADAQNAAQRLDLDTVIRGARAISGEIIPDQLIAKLMNIVIENAGAERGLLLLDRDGVLMIEAHGAIGHPAEMLAPAPAEGDPRIPWSMVNYVARTGESLVLADASAGPYALDPYVVSSGARSVLVAPLVNQGRLVAVIYLENTLGVGVFTAERLQVVTLLLAQSALSLHNASLYASLRISNARLEEYNRTLEAKVEERTHELQKAQRQLATQEKLASLGTITAGVAHELRNPLNFVSNFAEINQDLLVELDEHLRDSAERSPPAATGLVENTIAALKGNAGRIREHSKRANGIISAMLLHARSSFAAREDLNLAVTVSESIALAVEGARAQMPGLTVHVDERYDPRVGTVSARAQDIQRVVLNLVNNACHAVWKKQQTGQPGFVAAISVITRDRGHTVELRIRDNGDGIPPEIAERLFTPFLTTKGPNEGTGLGLSLCHNIVVQGHGGELRIESIPGEYAEAVVRLPRTGWSSASQDPAPAQDAG